MDRYIVSFRNGRRRSPPYISTPSRLVSRRATLDIEDRLSKFSAELLSGGREWTARIAIGRPPAI